MANCQYSISFVHNLFKWSADSKAHLDSSYFCDHSYFKFHNKVYKYKLFAKRYLLMEQMEQEYIIAIELLKNNQQIMNEKMDAIRHDLTKGFESVETKISELRTEMNEMDTRNEKKYASILTERIVYGMVGIMISAIIVALLALIIR